MTPQTPFDVMRDVAKRRPGQHGSAEAGKRRSDAGEIVEFDPSLVDHRRTCAAKRGSSSLLRSLQVLFAKAEYQHRLAPGEGMILHLYGRDVLQCAKRVANG